MEKDDNIINSEENIDVPPEEQKINLKEIRESKGLTLREISRSTRISHTILVMIETEKFESLPEPVYSMAFIRKYAEILGIDSEEILSGYNQYLREREISGKQDKGRKKKSWAISNYSLTMLGACIVALVLVFTFYFFRQDYLGERGAVQKQVAEETSKIPPAETSTSENLEEKESTDMPLHVSPIYPELVEKKEPVVYQNLPDSESQEKTESEPPIAEKEEITEDQKPITEAKVYKLTIKAKELTWLKISKDGEAPLEIMLRRGETIERNSMEKFRVTIGNAGGVDVTFDGKSLGKLGAQGEVVHLNLP